MYYVRECVRKRFSCEYYYLLYNYYVLYNQWAVRPTEIKNLNLNYLRCAQ